MSLPKCNRKILRAVVVSNKAPKMLVVRHDSFKRHPVYGKVVSFRKKLYVHVDQQNVPAIGDEVTIVESRPFSKLKKWRLLNENTASVTMQND